MQEIELAEDVGVFCGYSLGLEHRNPEHEAVSELEVIGQRVDVELALVAAVRRPRKKRRSTSFAAAAATSSSLGPPLLCLGEETVVDEPLALHDAQVVFGIRPGKGEGMKFVENSAP